jgi:hypothetical protein
MDKLVILQLLLPSLLRIDQLLNSQLLPQSLWRMDKLLHLQLLHPSLLRIDQLLNS